VQIKPAVTKRNVICHNLI